MQNTSSHFNESFEIISPVDLEDDPDMVQVPSKAMQPPSNRLGRLEGWNVGSRYHLIRVLAHGSYGEVAEAIDSRSVHACNI